ncbi:MAG TPA: hypothetical protein VFD54_05120 [Anaerolineales bacterium]|jgi:hypothetical protein|nr:hypothetical protein [Anaerolineales bacterium]
MTEEQLLEIEKRYKATTSGQWFASIEGRDHTSGESVILRGENKRETDLYLIGGTIEDYDFIAHARQDIPTLITEIRRLSDLIDQLRKSTGN